MAKSITRDTASAQEGDIVRLTKIQNAICDLIFSTAGLAIGTTTTKAKIATAFRFFVDGVYGLKAVTDDAFTLSGTVTNAKFNVFCMYIASDGTVSTLMGTEATTRAGVVFPTTPSGYAMIGYIEINPTGTGDFVGGTTPLGDATVAPNAVYVNTPYPFNPNVITL